jgi:asparagine synthase (glutamine-hydrolysing)
MCGLCGFTGEIIDRDAIVKNMTDVITHRGPDSSGIYIDSDIAMGISPSEHHRLRPRRSADLQ